MASQLEPAYIGAAIRAMSPRSPLAGEGAAFSAASERYNVDWRFLVAIAGAETSFATYGPSQPIHNPFGMGPGISYPSWSASIVAAAKNLRENYMNQGLKTVAQIQGKWAPGGAANDPTGLNSNWTRNVTSYLTRLGGNPSKLERSNVAGGSGGTLDGIRSIPGDAADVAGDAAGAVADAVTNPIAGLVQLLARLFDPSVWFRVLAAVGGTIAIVLALVLFVRGRAIPSRR